LVCWGGNLNGELGDGSALTKHHPPSIVPLPLFASETILSVSSNRGRSVGVVSSFNRLFVWGSGVESQLGDGFNSNREMPVSDLKLFPDSGMAMQCDVLEKKFYRRRQTDRDFEADPMLNVATWSRSNRHLRRCVL
jgi:hypothetical protein